MPKWIQKDKSADILLTKEELDRQRRLNKQRAKRMEKEIMSELGAFQTPMSGAGIIKGDGFIQLPLGGIAVIECKVSSQIHEKLGPFLRFRKGYSIKLENDVNAMRSLGARFGFFAFKWHSYRDRILAIPINHIDQFGITEVKDTTIPLLYTKAGKLIVTVPLYRNVLVNSIGGKLELYNGMHYITTVERIKQCIKSMTP